MVVLDTSNTSGKSAASPPGPRRATGCPQCLASMPSTRGCVHPCRRVCAPPTTGGEPPSALVLAPARAIRPCGHVSRRRRVGVRWPTQVSPRHSACPCRLAAGAPRSGRAGTGPGGDAIGSQLCLLARPVRPFQSRGPAANAIWSCRRRAAPLAPAASPPQTAPHFELVELQDLIQCRPPPLTVCDSASPILPRGCRAGDSGVLHAQSSWSAPWIVRGECGGRLNDRDAVALEDYRHPSSGATYFKILSMTCAL